MEEGQQGELSCHSQSHLDSAGPLSLPPKPGSSDCQDPMWVGLLQSLMGIFDGSLPGILVWDTRDDTRGLFTQ